LTPPPEIKRRSKVEIEEKKSRVRRNEKKWGGEEKSRRKETTRGMQGKYNRRPSVEYKRVVGRRSGIQERML
tara:strand:- start:25 stop:240 length:216 start_codon:yes stop_codon:yes gene_type:complete